MTPKKPAPRPPAIDADDYVSVEWLRDNFAEVAAEADAALRARRPGRPKKGTKSEATSVRSIRLPVSTWRSLERSAAARKVSVNALMNALAELVHVPGKHKRSA